MLVVTGSPGAGQSNSGRPRLPGGLRSVDCWPLAKNFTRFRGVSLARYPLTSVDVTGPGCPPPEVCISQGLQRPVGPRGLWGGPRLRELSGGNWMVLRVSL